MSSERSSNLSTADAGAQQVQQAPSRHNAPGNGRPLMPAVRRQLQPLLRQVPHAHALQQVGGLVVGRAGLLPAAFEFAESRVTHGA